MLKVCPATCRRDASSAISIIEQCRSKLTHVHLIRIYCTSWCRRDMYRIFLLRFPRVRPASRTFKDPRTLTVQHSSCEEPLVNSHTDLWCATHIYKKLECHVPSCTTALIPGENWKSCTLAAHRDQEVLIRARIASTPAWELHRRPGASRSNTAPDVVPPIDSAANPSHGISFEDVRVLSRSHSPAANSYFL